MKVNDNDYSAIGKIKSLTNLSIDLCNISDVSWIGSLENLTNLTIINSQLNKGIKALSNLSKLKYLNLQNNTLYDMSLYENQVYNTCEVLASMNKYKGGALENLFLDGNPNITDFSFVKECKWTSKSGF
jgi:Leucine-rich repeat (LRR) protein